MNKLEILDYGPALVLNSHPSFTDAFICCICETRVWQGAALSSPLTPSQANLHIPWRQISSPCHLKLPMSPTSSVLLSLSPPEHCGNHLTWQTLCVQSVQRPIGLPHAYQAHPITVHKTCFQNFWNSSLRKVLFPSHEISRKPSVFTLLWTTMAYLWLGHRTKIYLWAAKHQAPWQVHTYFPYKVVNLIMKILSHLSNWNSELQPWLCYRTIWKHLYI